MCRSYIEPLAFPLILSSSITGPGHPFTAPCRTLPPLTPKCTRVCISHPASGVYSVSHSCLLGRSCVGGRTASVAIDSLEVAHDIDRSPGQVDSFQSDWQRYLS